MSVGLPSQWKLALVLALLSVSIASPVGAQPYLTQEAAPRPNAARRIGISSAVTLSVAGATALGVGAGLGMARRCRTRLDSQDGEDGLFTGLGCAITGAGVLMGVTFTAVPLAMTLGSYFTHRGQGGRGRWWTAFLGSGLGTIAAFGIVDGALGISDSRASAITATTVGLIVATAFPIAALEWSHARQVERARPLESARTRVVMPVASALPGGGGWLGVAGAL